ncbi:glycine cleavage system protein H [Paenibacillus aestuarii]|uniref:Glycine cleavage system protein H n=1 Tax=Paenibacillus aestuarii TaxID=516965 RepID=A0ABW0K8L1_9BACL|nr:glycine cleavage system protein H [Paenibacillus aestuarii]
MFVPAHLKYTRNHYWVRVEAQQAVIGLSEFGLAQLGMLLFLELPERDSHLRQGDFFGTAETVEAEHDLYAPLSGKVTAVNMLLERATLTLYESPYERGWLMTVQWEHASELEQLLDAEAYERLIAEE